MLKIKMILFCLMISIIITHTILFAAEFENGTQSYLPQSRLLSGYTECGDFNGDGLMDIIFAESTTPPYSRLWMQNEEGLFVDETYTRLPFNSNLGGKIEIFDIDNDGDSDIFFTCRFSNVNPTPSLLINNGDGYFTDESHLRLPSPSSYGTYIHRSEAGKIDDDPYIDILLIMDPPSIMLLRNNGNGFFSIDTEDRFPDAQYGFRNFDLTDIDNDGLNDVIFANYPFQESDYVGGVACYRNTGDGFYVDETEMRIPVSPYFKCENIMFGDIDNDNDTDMAVISAEASGDSIDLYLNDGTGIYIESEYSFPVTPPLSWTYKGRFAHLNDDDFIDLFVPNWSGWSNVNTPGLLFMNNGDGTFSDSTSLLPHAPSDCGRCAIFDHKLDGDMDIFVTKYDAQLSPYVAQNVLYENLVYDLQEELSSTLYGSWDYSSGDPQAYLHWEFTEEIPENLTGYFIFKRYDSEEYGNTPYFATDDIELAEFWDDTFDTECDSVYYIVKTAFYGATYSSNEVSLELPSSGIDLFENPITSIPSEPLLEQNYPNPFNPETTIRFEVPASSSHRGLRLQLRIYDISGKSVKTLVDREVEPGNHSVVWNGKDDTGNDVASGLYFYKIETENFNQIKQCLLLK